MFRLILILTTLLIACGGEVQHEDPTNQSNQSEQDNQCEGDDCENDDSSCEGDDDCATDEVCFQQTCRDASQVDCSAGGTRCGDDEVCVESEICDGDDCQQFRQCRSSCEGQICGFGGELCCTGDTPVCGPHGECAPDCSNSGGLCGDDFDDCCPWGEACVFGECRAWGEECDSFADCGFDEYCDPGLGRCMPDDFPDDLVCEADVDFDPFDVEELWHWDGVEVNGVLKANVANTPAVLDMTGDGTPEVIFTAYANNINRGVLVVIDGVDGETIYVNRHAWLRSREAPAVGDIDGDGKPEIIVSTVNGLAMIDDLQSCPDPDGDQDNCIAWTENIGSVSLNQAPSLADVTGDGTPEVVYLHSIYDGETGQRIAGAPQGQVSMPVAMDLTGDGQVEVLTSGCAFRYEDGESDLQEVWCNGDLPGSNTRASDARNYVAVGDVVGGARAGLPEVIWVGDGELFVVDASDGEILERLDVPGAVRGGPPVVADFDGDGSAEIGVGGQTCYTVFDMDCLGSDDEDLPGCERPEFEECTPGVDCVIEPCADVAGGTGDGILWSIEIVDSVTGTGFASAVFDFQGNDRHEVVYGDHCRVFVLDGQTGSPLFTRFASRRANVEMPIVVDVDGDGRSNLVFQANNDQFNRDCVDPIADRPDFFPECYEDDPPDHCSEGNQGIFALRDVHDAWVSTRAVWNQHAYHITNINDDGTIPANPAPFWEQFNTFRANRQGWVPLNAADPQVTSIQVNALECPADIYLQATIENPGMAAIPADMPVSLYLLGADGAGQLVETRPVGAPIPPGGLVTVDFVYEITVGQLNQELDFMIVANDDGADGSPVQDCNPDNASGLVEGVVCAYQL